MDNEQELEKLRLNMREMLATEKNNIDKIASLEKENAILKQQKTIAEARSEKLRGTISFRLGHAILQAGKSWHGLSILPKTLYELRVDAKKRRTQNTPNNQQITSSYQIPSFILPSNSKIKIAGVMDEFTFHSYAPECDILQLHPVEWEKQLKEFSPDILFIESAWKGLDGLWQTKISNYSEEISNAIAWCRNNNIPTIFWNKEDPVHFSTFIPIAKAVDYVFTTDIDCIPKYKYYVDHERVYLLPFAAQPKIHNPIEKYQRKDAFNFAGSYYLRYPERQRDFASLIETVKEFKPVEIYDRNYGDAHPHYKFPEEYKNMILGKLPFTDIDIAYKGYRYGINMNTIKQSQTMFARRVFELLASNTVVVSNFARGARLLFGDLIISSDNKIALAERLKKICTDETTYRKFRLLGLRRVMQEHTYRHRLNYILSKICKSTISIKQDLIVICAIANTREELNKLFNSFSKQRYGNKKFFILDKTDCVLENNIQGINHYKSREDLFNALHDIDSPYLMGGMSHNDFYGEMYLIDLQLATTYSTSSAFTKKAHYTFERSKIELVNENDTYKVAQEACITASLVKSQNISIDVFLDSLFNNTPITLDNILSIDQFNYIRNGSSLPEHECLLAKDIELTNTGVLCSSELSTVAESLSKATNIKQSNSHGLPELGAEDLAKMFSSAGKVRISLHDNKLRLQSSLEADKHSYIYSKQIMSREEMNLVVNSQFQVITDGPYEIRTIFEFQDQHNKKISHQINPVGRKHFLAIPDECKYIRLGLRVQGSGEIKIRSIIFGSNPEQPAEIVCKSDTIVLSKQYPAYDDLYKYGFLHSRVRAYAKEGIMVDVFRVSDLPSRYREFENIDIVSGSLELLDATLASGRIKNVLVHIIDEKMWRILSKHIHNINVTIWVHGAEIQVWQRRSFEFERMTGDEIARQKKLSDKRKRFWIQLLSYPPQNLHLVFVSQTFADEVMRDIGIKIPEHLYSVIHNYVDEDIFSYTKKPIELRNKVLSIRSFASRKYGNDLSVKAIQELSKRPCFKDMTFHIIGDGDLFDNIVEPLKSFSNIIIEKRFLTHHQISTIQNDYGVFLNPTRWDSQGVSRDEAMSSGLVPVTTRVAAVPEFVDDSSGKLVESEDYYALAEALENLSTNPDVFSTLSRRASERTRLQCSYEKTIKREISLFSK